MTKDVRHAIITGGSSGIGLATAKLLVRRGSSVTLIARTRSALDASVAMLLPLRVSSQQRIEAASADVADRGDIEAAIDGAMAALGPPDLLMLSAGICHPGHVADLSAEVFERTNAVNYLGSVYPILSCLPAMRQQRFGKIVIVSSGAGLAGIFGYTPYSPTKFALRGLAESLRAEVVRSGVDVSIVYPPDTDTPQLAYENRLKPEETKRIGGAAGLWQADAVARVILSGVDRRKFSIPVGAQLRLLDVMGGILAPALRWHFDRVAASVPKGEIQS